MKDLLQPWVARALSSDQLLAAKRWLAEQRRRYRKLPHKVDVFIKVDDPYSYLLLQALTEFERRYNVLFQYHIVSDMQSAMFPEPDLWRDNAFRDASYLATLYNFDYPAQSLNLTASDTAAVAAQLLAISGQPDFSQRAVNILRDYWANQSNLNNSLKDPTEALANNDRLLASMGHYFSAMLHYNGEWYWGVDRLVHLEERLNGLGLAINTALPQELVYNKTSGHFCQRMELTRAHSRRPATPLKLFFSARSPYSYLGLERTVALANHYGISLEVKPVLPMMMRGMYVPPSKKWYIFHDTKREARRLGIDYGFVADPLGPAVERCYALFNYASSEGKAIDFLLSFARAVNAEGIRADTDSGLQRIVERSGLSWSMAQPLLNDDSWRDWAEANYQEMHNLGLWGVPSIQYGELAVWGQDRIDVIEQAICQDIITLNTASS